MKLFISLFVTVCVSFGARPNAIAGDEEVALLRKKFQEVSDKYPAYEDAALAKKELQKAIEEYRDQTKGKSGICPVHKIEMLVKEVPFRFGLLARLSPREIKEAQFPFSDEFISGGCLHDDALFPKTGKLFLCPQCVAARSRWLDIANKKVEENKSK